MKTILLGVLLCFSLAQSRDTLRITFGHPEDTKMYKVAERYIEEMNRRSDTIPALQIIYQTFGRSFESLIHGKTDGDFSRTALVYKGQSNVVKVEEVLMLNHYFGYALQSYLDTISSTINPSALYLVPIGNKIIKNWLNQSGLRFYEVRDYRQAVQMLSMNRADILIETHLFAFDSLVRDKQISYSGEPIFSEPLYLFLHKKHDKWSGAYAKIIAELAKEQFLARLLQGEIE